MTASGREVQQGLVTITPKILPWVFDGKLSYLWGIQSHGLQGSWEHPWPPIVDPEFQCTQRCHESSSQGPVVSDSTPPQPASGSVHTLARPHAHHA